MVIDYAYQAPIDSILGGPLFASPEREIKQEEESIVLTLVEESVNLVYPQVPLFPHIEDYLWPDFSDDADSFFEQFEELEELASYRSESLCLLPPRVSTLQSIKEGLNSFKVGNLKSLISTTFRHRFGRNPYPSRPASHR